MSEPYRTITLGEALSPDCIKKLERFLEQVRNKTLIIEEGKTLAQVLRERVLEPHRAELEGTWDLHYLAYAICHVCKL